VFWGGKKRKREERGIDKEENDGVGRWRIRSLKE